MVNKEAGPTVEHRVIPIRAERERLGQRALLNQVPTLLSYPYRSLIVTLIDPFKGTLIKIWKT